MIFGTVITSAVMIENPRAMSEMPKGSLFFFFFTCSHLLFVLVFSYGLRKFRLKKIDPAFSGGMCKVDINFSITVVDGLTSSLITFDKVFLSTVDAVDKSIILSRFCSTMIFFNSTTSTLYFCVRFKTSPPILTDFVRIYYHCLRHVSIHFCKFRKFCFFMRKKYCVLRKNMIFFIQAHNKGGENDVYLE